MSAKIVQLLERVTVRRKAVSKQFHGEVLFATAGIFRIGDPTCGDHKIFAQDFADVLKERRSDSFHHISFVGVAASPYSGQERINRSNVDAVIAELLNFLWRDFWRQ